MPCGLSVRLVLLPFGVAVCVLLSVRNETVCMSVCCRSLFWRGHYVFYGLTSKRRPEDDLYIVRNM